jgi:hypothetical protein
MPISGFKSLQPILSRRQEGRSGDPMSGGRRARTCALTDRSSPVATAAIARTGMDGAPDEDVETFCLGWQW